MSESCPRLGLVIAGVQKAGTSSLKDYLGQHPGIRMHASGEFTFFVNDEQYAMGYEAVFPRYFYEQAADDAIVAAKSAGLIHYTTAIDRLHHHNPETRLAILLRHPVERAYSAFWYARRLGWETASSFSEVLERDPSETSGDPIRDRNCAYVANGYYEQQLEVLADRFKRDAIRLFLFERFREEPLAVCRELFDWLGVDPDFEPDVAVRRNPASSARFAAINRAVHGQGAAKTVARRLLPGPWIQRLKSLAVRANTREFERPPLDNGLRARLVEHYRPHNERLARSTGLDLSPWQQ